VVSAVANGRTPGVLKDFVSVKGIGTTFIPKSSHMVSRQHWLVHGKKIKGTLVIDGGAETALIKAKTSLLPVGVKEFTGRFDKGDSVSVKNEAGDEIARGLVEYSSDNLKRILGLKSSQVEKVLGGEYVDEVIHRDNLVLMERSARGGQGA
jgi:glutamate 5-kinase